MKLKFEPGKVLPEARKMQISRKEKHQRYCEMCDKIANYN
jgi:hypothetical protein